jgi:hypothetical protein
MEEGICVRDDTRSGRIAIIIIIINLEGGG